MQTHQLKPKYKPKKSQRVGRGGKKGTYSGKGIKGQASRAGRKMVPIIRELVKRYPKLKGYRRSKLKVYAEVINLDVLDKKFQDGDVINPQNLIKKEIIRSVKGKVPKVKILGMGQMSKKLIIEDCSISNSAKQAIEKAGGTIK